MISQTGCRLFYNALTLHRSYKFGPIMIKFDIIGKTFPNKRNFSYLDMPHVLFIPCKLIELLNEHTEIEGIAHFFLA